MSGEVNQNNRNHFRYDYDKTSQFPIYLEKQKKWPRFLYVCGGLCRNIETDGERQGKVVRKRIWGALWGHNLPSYPDQDYQSKIEFSEDLEVQIGKILADEFTRQSAW